jgi:RNA polymerase sigma-70 factor, ECF subfamily
LSTNHKTGEDLKKELMQVEAAKADPARFDALYDKYYKPIFVFIYRRTGEEGLTADITSMVFLKALVNIKNYRDKGVPFSAWLYRIALNEISMYFRKNNSGRVVSLKQEHISTIVDEVEKDNTEENCSIVMNALKKVKEESVQLIEMRFFEKRSFSEIGNILGISENNAKVKVYRVLDKLKSIILNKE